jgi:hypothetical protein
MKFLLVLAGFILSCSTAYGQLALVHQVINEKGNSWYSYIDTTSFQDNGYDSVDGNYYILENGKSVKSNKREYLFKLVTATKPIGEVINIADINSVEWKTLVCGIDSNIYLERWLERQKKAKEEKETKGNKQPR